ncbi:XRE family transcriptional regulator [Streptomyces nanhaiensis]|uniref:XRE family transcriptional regulator n=1 Tax=Streptomyces nanhaiensis TaxID=679319 RepID=UPI00399D1DE4
MTARSLENTPAGIRDVRTVETLRTERSLTQRQTTDHATSFGHPMPPRIKCAQRRCDADDLAAIAEALLASPLVLPQGPTVP